MTRQQAPRYKPGPDPYAAQRCINCSHLRYRDQRPGDACQVCDCTTHVVPAEISPEVTP